MDAIRVTVRRGNIVEAVHRVHVATTDGEVWGDPELAFFFRSSSKPIQAIPFLEGYADLDDDEIAIACASHHAEPAQLDAVRRVLARAGATVDDLENGLQDGRPEGKLGHNCSGKHAGMLAACRAFGAASIRIARPIIRCSSASPAPRRLGKIATDGCGVPTFSTTLARAAVLLTRTPPRIRAAMQARPELIGASHGAVDTDLMRLRRGWIAKGGAEGLFCAAHDDGRGIALKAEDGAYRAIGPALAHVLGIDELAETPLVNSRDEVVGAITLAP